MSEIKEILEDIKGIYYFKPLLDYITSLEQQVQDLKADYGSKSQVERDLLEQENERLKEEIENLTHIVANKIIEDYDIDTPLKNQLNEERIKYINLGVVCNDYKSRCEKALEYIKCGITGDLENDRAYVDENALLNILNGGDDNE